jgi:hypothetical protein
LSAVLRGKTPRPLSFAYLGQGSGAMSVHNIDNKRKHRKIRCNSIEYDEGAQGYSESAYPWRSLRDLYQLGRARSNQEFYEGG